MAQTEPLQFPGSSEPNSLEAEQALLAAILIRNDALYQVGGLRAEHFYEPVHGRIFDACKRLIEKGQAANPATLRAAFEADPALADLEGGNYLHRLASGAVTTTQAGSYAAAIRDTALRRSTIRACVEGAGAARDYARGAEDILAGVQGQLVSLSESVERSAVRHDEAVARTLEEIEAAQKSQGLRGISSGFADYDRKLGGLHGSDLVIVAARPNMGKTAVALHIAESAKVPVAFFSLEMSYQQIAQRSLSRATGIPYFRMRSGLRDDEIRRMADAAQKLADLPIYIDDSPALTPSQIRARAMTLRNKARVGLVVVDHLQKVRPDHRSGNRVGDFSDISGALKDLAKSLEVPVVVLSQLSRAIESHERKDKRPLLQDLRESGAIEQDADVVIGLYREEYYLEQREPKDRTSYDHTQWQADMDKVKNLTELLVRKNRHGPKPTIVVKSALETNQYWDLAQ